MDYMKILLTRLHELLLQCDRRIKVPDEERICLNCRFRGRTSEALCECSIDKSIGSKDDTCGKFRMSLDYLQSKLMEEVIHEQG